jgi:hypothetical protein
METKVIRLKTPVRAGKEILPHNAVVEMEAGEADKLLDYNPPLAEETDTHERYPVNQPILKIHDYPITGTEKFPLAEDHKFTATPAMFSNEFDRQTEALIRNSGPGPGEVTKERAPAKIDQSTVDRKKAKEEQEAAAQARLAEAVPVVLVEDDKSKGKGK